MKKLNLLFVMFALFAAVSFVSSCKDDSTTADLVIDATPDATATYTAGSTVNYKVVITSGETLKSLIVTATVGGSVQTPVTVFSSNTTSSYNATYSYTIPTTCSAGDKISLSFVVIDKGARTQTKTPDIITVKAAGSTTTATTPYTYTAKLLGSQSNAAGSFFFTTDGTVHTVNEAYAAQSSVDFFYFHTATNGATISSPDATDIWTAAGFATSLKLSSYTTKNATRFAFLSAAVKTSLASTWSSVSNETIATTVTSTDLTENAAAGLAVGSIFGFKTAAGVKGLIKVVALDDTDNGTITIDVKVTNPNGAALAKK